VPHLSAAVDFGLGFSQIEANVMVNLAGFGVGCRFAFS
jgi:hypothetical protein